MFQKVQMFNLNMNYPIKNYNIDTYTNYLINNDINSTSSKNLSAKKLGIPIISEDTLLEMLTSCD